MSAFDEEVQRRDAAQKRRADRDSAQQQHAEEAVAVIKQTLKDLVGYLTKQGLQRSVYVHTWTAGRGLMRRPKKWTAPEGFVTFEYFNGNNLLTSVQVLTPDGRLWEFHDAASDRWDSNEGTMTMGYVNITPEALVGHRITLGGSKVRLDSRGELEMGYGDIYSAFVKKAVELGTHLASKAK